MDRTRREVTGQASSQQQRAAESLRSLSTELREMAGARQESGVATDLAQQAADKTDRLASWLQDREPGDVLDEVSRFARRRPGVFLALAAGAGVVAGRLTRGMAAGAPSDPGTSATSAYGRHAAEATASGEGAGTPEAGLSPLAPSPGLETTGPGQSVTDGGAAGTDLPSGKDVTR